MDLTVENFRHWSPIRLYENGGRLFVDWVYLGDKRFTEPFHDHTIDVLFQKPFHLFFRHQTPVEFLGELYENSKGVAPCGFIFHVSRCGSTLVSQMFAALEKNIALSESSILDSIVRFNMPDETKITLLRWTVNALARKRFATEENLFIKFDSWAVLDLPLIERAFPAVPWIFMYREPVEVIVSNLRQPGAQMIPGAIQKIFPDLDFLEILQFTIEERFARTIAAFSRSAIENASSAHGKLINYNQLPNAVTNEICTHFNVDFSAEELEKMRRSSKFHAKTPRLEFKPDSTEKRLEASETVVRFAEEFVRPLYEKLEELRTANDL